MKCPKCKAVSGDDWTQCNGSCPMEQSPHYPEKMLDIPISAAERIAKDYGYDQVVIIARRVGNDPQPHGEHVTTYGRTKAHCAVAAHVGSFIKTKIMKWPE